MIPMSVAEVADAVAGSLSLNGAAGGAPVAGPVVIDSRLAGPGSIFAAIKGEQVDGAEFAPTSVGRGAALILAEREIADPGAPVVVVDNMEKALADLARHSLAAARAANPALKVLAVTGSQGKTTTKDLLAAILTTPSVAGHEIPGCVGTDPTHTGMTGLGERATGRDDTPSVIPARGASDTTRNLTATKVVAPKGSFNNELGLPLTVLQIGLETEFAALEMGADRPGNIADLTNIAPPEVGIVLTVGTAHLETFGSRDGIAAAKSEMVSGVRPGGVAVLNFDDHRVLAMRDIADQRGIRAVTFGRGEGADVRAVNVNVDDGGRASFTMSILPAAFRGAGASADAHTESDKVADSGGRLELPVALQVPGEHNVSNALAAATAAMLAGITPEAVAERLSRATLASPHRMAVTERPDGVTIIDDAYNANPESMGAAMRTLAKIAAGRRSVAVIGQMRELGPDAAEAHAEIGRLAVRLGIDKLVVVGEPAKAAYDAAVQEGSWGDEAMFVADLDAARDALAGLLERGDVVLIKASNGARLWQLADQLTGATATGASGASLP